MAKVLVTGASGFIGSHVAEALVARGDEVAALVRPSSRADWLRSLGVSLAYGDLSDPDALRAATAGRSVVYHVAGLTRALRAKDLFRVNEQGVQNVACAEQLDPPVLIVLSSLAAAGPSPRGRPRTDADPLHPVSKYGRSKRAGELAAERFAHRVPITVVRPPIVFGERDRAGLGMFKSIARTGFHLVPGWALNTYSLIHAADLAQLLILAAQRGARLPPADSPGSPSPQGYYFAAGDEHPTWRELGRMIRDALGRRWHLMLPIAVPAIWIAGAVTEMAGWICRYPFYLKIDKVREVSAGSWTCSPEKAAEELGFSVAAPLAHRLGQTARWYRDAGWL
jgi:nucleoside-diphosphate-sugar epimerase